MTTITAPAKTKITVSLSDEAAEAVQTLAEQRGISVSEVIRRAIALERFVEGELEKGSTLLVRNENGETERVAFVFG